MDDPFLILFHRVVTITKIIINVNVAKVDLNIILVIRITDSFIFFFWNKRKLIVTIFYIK